MDKAFERYQLPTANSNKTLDSNLKLGLVDDLAENLAREFGNLSYKAWYCGLIYKFGPATVEEWRKRSITAKDPGKVFSKYAAQAGGYKKSYEK